MRKKIRKGIFETNSSSSHSLSVSRMQNYDYTSLREHIDLDGILHIYPKDFEWEIRAYSFPYDKIQYALAMINMTEGEGRGKASVNDIYETEGFQLLKSTIMENIPECKDVVVEAANESWNSPFGHIDHQSCECYESLQHFLNDYDVTLEEFIFNIGVILKTDNDNH